KGTVPPGAQREPASVTLAVNSEGGTLIEQITARLVNYTLAIFIDDELVSAPRVKGPISGGNGVIEGLALDEAKTLKVQLNAGALPVPLHTVQTSEVDATLHETTLVRTVQAGTNGIFAAMVFMILCYQRPCG